MSKWEPSNSEMRQVINDIHSIASSLKKLAATAEESTHTIKEFHEYIVLENEKFEREQKEGLERIEQEVEEKKRQEAAKAFDEGFLDSLTNAWHYKPCDDEDGTWHAIPIEPDRAPKGPLQNGVPMWKLMEEARENAIPIEPDPDERG